MMYLHPPFYMFEGVAVIPDYDDPNQYYYFPNRPHLAVDNGHPAVRLLVYKADLDELKPEEEAVAGFFYFDTTLEWPDATLKKVAKKIQDQENLERLPRLSPLLYKSGTVRLIFLDKTTPPPTPPGGGTGSGAGDGDTSQPAKDRWVIKLESSGVPSLYGDNRAIFSAVLTKEATQLLYSAFDGFIPAGVVYDLTFVGMQRAFNVHVSADWEQVYHFMDEKTSVDLFFFQSEVEDIVSQLFDKKIIKIEASLEGVGDEGMENEFNAVRKQLTEFVLDKFFKPVPFPDKQDVNESTEGRIVDFARDLRTLGYPSVGYSRRTVDINEVRTIDIDYTVSRAVERKIAPQAHISLFFEDFQLKREQVITVVNGADDFWKTVDFNVAANADFDGDGIFGVGVDVAYGPDSQPGPNGEPTVTWASLLSKSAPNFKKSSWFDPAGGRQYAYRYKTFFTAGALPGPEQEVQSGWHNDSGNVLVVTPTELYLKRRLEFQLVKNFPADLFPQAQVEISYTDPGSGWTFHDSALIDPSSPRAVFAFRARREAPSTVSYRYQFVHTGGPTQTDWQTTESDLVLVMDPRHNLFRVNILVAGDRSKIQELLLNFRFEDPVDGHVETKFIHLSKTNINDSQEWIFAPTDPKQHRYSYSQLLMDTDGNLVETGQVQEEKNTLPVGVIYAKRWEVRPELIGPPLADNGLEKIKLSLHYIDETNSVLSDKQMVFVQPGKGEPWLLELKDPLVRSYTYEVSYVQQNGFEHRIGPLSGTDTFLIISSVPPV
jgi:hypothetical protein